MASPFNVFRKHQKVILVAAGVLCMFVFVIGDVLFQLVGSGSGGGDGASYDDVAVRWSGGELTRGEVASMVARRNVLRIFLRRARDLGRSPGDDPMAVLAVREVIPLDVSRDQFPEQEVVFRHLLAEKARDAGMVVSDDVINHYLGQITQGRVDSDGLRQLVAEHQVGGRPIGMNYIFDALQEEMLAQAYLDSYDPLLRTVTPAQQWQDWRRVNDRVVVETLAVPVGNFVDQVKDPSNADLTAFYEKYKDRQPENVIVQPFTELPSPDPAFRVPRKVEIHYLEANFETIAGRLANDVTDEEIRTYYEEHKDRYIRPQLDLGIEGTDDATTQPLEGMPPEPDEAGLPSSTDQDQTIQPPPDGDAFNTAPPDDANGDSPPSPNDQGNGVPGGPQSPENASESSHLFLPANEPTQFVVFQETGQDVLPDAPPGAGADDFQQGASDAVAAVADSTNPPVDDTAANPVVPSTDQGAADNAANPSGEPVLEGLPPEPDEPATGPAVEYLPLDVVRDEIRKAIAEERVPEKLHEIMPLIQSDLMAAYTDYEDRQFDAQDDGKDPGQVAPPELNLQEIAEKYGLVAKQTAPVSLLEIRQTPLGESLVRESSTPYAFIAFSDLPLYQPVWTIGIADFIQQMRGYFNEYIAVKVDDTGANTPELDEIRDEVVRAYKRVQARDLAIAAAENLAKGAQSGQTTLQEQFADNDQYSVVQSDPFSWYDLNLGQFDSRFHLGEPYGVEHAGPEFMETVFSLDEGEAAAVWNHDRSIAYVVRLDRHQRSEDALRNSFLQEVNRSATRLATDSLRTRELSQALLVSIQDEAGLEWVVTPDQPVTDET